MIALKCILFACLVSVALATKGGGNQCKRERGDRALGELPLIDISVGRTYPNCRITCVRCTGPLGNLLDLNINIGGYGCSNIKVGLNLGALLGTCTVYGKDLNKGEKDIICD